MQAGDADQRMQEPGVYAEEGHPHLLGRERELGGYYREREVHGIDRNNAIHTRPTQTTQYVDNVMKEIYNNGPVQIGFRVYKSFMTCK